MRTEMQSCGVLIRHYQGKNNNFSVCHCECRFVTTEFGSYSISGLFTPCKSPTISVIVTKITELLENLTESPKNLRVKSKPYLEILELLLTGFSFCLLP